MNDIALVSGASGFIGRHVCRELSRIGMIVHGIGHGSWSAAEQTDWGLKKWTELDINSASLEQGLADEAPSVLVHCAGSGAVGRSYAHPLDDFERSVGSTACVLDLARTLPKTLRRVVVISSAAVYGDHGDVDLVETATRSPASPYGFHKLAAETLCESYSRFFGLSVSIVRLFSVYGGGLRKQLLWDACVKFNRGEGKFFGTGDELRDWIHVEDAAKLLSSAALQPQSRFEVYNGGHTQMTTRQILSMLSAELGVRGPDFTGELHPGNPRRLTSDSSHAKNNLGWVPTTSIEHGLRAYAAWFKADV